MQSLTLHFSLFTTQWNIFGIISRTVICRGVYSHLVATLFALFYEAQYDALKIQD